MTRDTRADQEGGSKRFLYTGPNKRRPGVTEDDDEEEIHWNFVNTLTHPGAQPYRPPDTDPSGFDVDGVWNIRKNITLPKAAPTIQDSLTRKTDKSYYSRHGGIADTEFDFTNGSNEPTSGQGDKSWSQSGNYSYSNHTPLASSSLAQSCTPTNSTQVGRHENDIPRQGVLGISQGMRGGHQKGHLAGGRYGLKESPRTHNSHNNNRPF